MLEYDYIGKVPYHDPVAIPSILIYLYSPNLPILITALVKHSLAGMLAIIVYILIIVRSNIQKDIKYQSSS
ncbi:hypothetical protein IM45_083 [Candidatus Palibaumannia cicadellinicola]|uniref:Uncharacterized protein n=1 Tax=Candidatus Palibaumannia cicadellinicola TaxID=186490 RepID=A0A088N9W9_9GAMM|nr:hypothetical protein IM45_083 [Candidatus Baumannia cicadellinicola]